MSAPDWGNWDSMAGDLDDAWQALYDMNVEAYHRDNEEMGAVRDLLEDKFNPIGPHDAGGEIDYVNGLFSDLCDQQRAAWEDLKGFWDATFAGDVAKAKEVYDTALVWKEDVIAKLGDHDVTVSQSPTRMASWTGPGAEAYNSKIPEQVQAMGDLKRHVQNLAFGAEQGALVIGWVYTTILSDLTTLTESIDQIPGDDSGATFGNRVWQARYLLEGQLAQLKDYESGDGIWQDQVEDARLAMADSVPDAEVLNSDGWPVASTESLQDIKPSDQPVSPTSTAPPPPPMAEPPVQPTAPTTGETPPPVPDASNTDDPSRSTEEQGGSVDDGW